MSLKGKNVIVTGSAGFIGSHLTLRLIQEGANVVVMYHDKMPVFLYAPLGNILSDLTFGPPFISHIPFRNDFDFKPEILFHMAGVTAGAGVVRGDPYALVNGNLVMCANIFEAAHRAGVKTVIFPSSTTGYPNVDHAVTEDEYCGDYFEGYATIGPVKRFVEQLAAIYPFTSVALRISNAYGPGDEFDPKRAHVTAATVRKVATRQNPIQVWGAGQEVRDILYIDDVVEGMIKAAEFAEVNPGTHEAFNLGSGEPYSVDNILYTLLQHEDYKPEIAYDKSKPTLMAKRLVSIEKAKAFLGWEPKVSTAEGLRRTLEWAKEHL